MNLKKAKNDIILYVVLLSMSFLIYFWIIPTQIQMNAMSKAETFNPDTFPKFVTVIWGIFAACGLFHSVRTYQKVKEKEGPGKREKVKKTTMEFIGSLIPYVFFVLAVVYGILFHIIGFIPSTIIMIPIMLLLVKCRKWSYYLIVYAFVALLYLLFRYILNVPIH